MQLAVLFFLGAGLAAAAWSSSTSSSSSSSSGSAWARSRGTRTPTTPARPEPTVSEAARICALSAEAVNLDGTDLAAWAECPGRAMRDLRVVAARLERAATDETADTARRERLINAHVALMDWIDRRGSSGGERVT